LSSEYHILVKDSGWTVEKRNGKRIGSLYRTKEEAVRAGRVALREAGGGQLVVHGRDGRIRDSDTVFGSA
jgi:hypothetical protein